MNDIRNSILGMGKSKQLGGENVNANPLLPKRIITYVPSFYAIPVRDGIIYPVVDSVDELSRNSIHDAIGNSISSSMPEGKREKT